MTKSIKQPTLIGSVITRRLASLERYLKLHRRFVKQLVRPIVGGLFVLIASVIVATPEQTSSTPLSLNQQADFPLSSSTKPVAFTFAPSKHTFAQAKRTHIAYAQVAKRSKPDFGTVLVPLYKRAAEQFGIDPKLLAAIHFVESGQSGDTPASYGSSAGARGPMQFMPPTFAAYKVDGDGDGVAHINDLDDSVYSAARYLAANGANRGQVDNALFRYNHSIAYVNKVKQIANDAVL